MARAYTEEQKNQVAELKKQAVPNKDISSRTGVSVYYVKGIVRELGLQLSPEQRQINVLAGITEKSPEHMQKMRAAKTKASDRRSAAGQRAAWKDPVYRQHQTEARREMWAKLKADPERMAARGDKISKALKERASKPDGSEPQ